MVASIEYNIVNGSPPFTFSVKDENLIEKFLYINQGKIYFDAVQSGTPKTYTVTVSKGSCVISNQVTSVSCGTTIVPVACNIPVLQIQSIVDNNIITSVVDSGSCNSYQYQYSNDASFSTFSSVERSCSSSATLVMPSSGTWYIRILKRCTNGNFFSNFVSAITNLQVSNCYTYASCQSIGANPGYDTYRINLKYPTDTNIDFTLNNGSVVTVYAGSDYGQEIVSIQNGCPTTTINSLNLPFCGLTPAPAPSPVNVPAPIGTPAPAPSLSIQCCNYSVDAFGGNLSDLWSMVYSDCLGITRNISGTVAELPATYSVYNITSISSNILVTNTGVCS